MWQRDYELARQVSLDREREMAARVLAAAAVRDVPRHNRVREASAASVRRLGQAVIALSIRIDSCAAQADTYRSRDISFH
jgi:hypothetical protein